MSRSVLLLALLGLCGRARRHRPASQPSVLPPRITLEMYRVQSPSVPHEDSPASRSLPPSVPAILFVVQQPALARASPRDG